MPSNEILVVYGWIYAQIVGDPVMQGLFAGRGLDVTNQVWEYRAPEGTAEPWIVYNRQASSDIRALGGHRIYSAIRCLIKVVGSGQDWSHEDIVGRLDALFDNVGLIPVAAPPGYIEASVRVEPYDLPEDVGGVQYRHLGGIYDIAAQGA